MDFHFKLFGNFFHFYDRRVGSRRVFNIFINGTSRYHWVH